MKVFLIASGIFFWLVVLYFIFMIIALSFKDWRAKKREQEALQRVPFPGSGPLPKY